MPNDPSALVVPFGKHKGLTVAELLATDPPYADWLVAQGWLADRFAALHQAIITRGAAHEDTPEHNTLQVRFLDRAFQVAFLFAAGRSDLNWRREQTIRNVQLRRELNVRDAEAQLKRGWRTTKTTAELETELIFSKEDLTLPIHLYFDTKVSFERNGVDVTLTWYFTSVLSEDFGGVCSVELKPSLGDDFPVVMRQMRRLNAPYLLVERYTGRAVSLEDLRQMFAANHQKLVLLQEIETELPEAHTFVDAYCS